MKVVHSTLVEHPCPLNVMKILSLIFSITFIKTVENHVQGTFKTIQTGPKPIWNETFLDKLKKDIFPNYDKYVRPENYNHVTNITFSFILLRVEAHEQQSTLEMIAWIKMIWTDSKLKWNKDDYGGISVIKIGDHEVWQPDIYLYNAAGMGGQLTSVGRRNVVINSNGVVTWVPPTKLMSLCNFNLRYWPFDTQDCYLKFGSWTHSSVDMELNMLNVDPEDMLEGTITSSPWTVNITGKKFQKQYACCVELYESIEYNLTLTRKSTPYQAIIVTPAVVSTMLILAQFWLPPYAGEKILLNGFAALILNIFLLYFSFQIISVGSETPLIVMFYSKSLYMVAFTTTTAIVTYLLCTLQKTRPLPLVIRYFLEGSCGKLVLFEQYPKKIFSDKHKESTEEISDRELSERHNVPSEDVHELERLIQNEWTLFAIFLDRLFFLIYTASYIILAILL